MIGGIDPDAYDESDAPTRPPRRTRPRSKQRPRHEDAVLGTVFSVDRGRFGVRLDTDDPGSRPTVSAVRAREMGRRAVVVGDRALVVGDVSGAEGTLARIVGITERRTTLRRTADDTDPVERVIVANADRLGIVVATVDPEPRLGFIDRCLVAAYHGGLRPTLIITKTDLYPADALVEAYGALDVPTVAIGRGDDPTPIAEHLAHHTTVLIGQAGVGKSTLVNELVPSADRATGGVNEVTGRGRHTSTSAVALELPGGGWIIDTPGLRSFGLAHATPDTVVAAFADVAPGTEHCPRACRHLDEHCALDEYARAEGPQTVERLASLRRVLLALDAPDESRN